MYYSSFSAAAAGMFNWPVIDLLQNKDESLSGQYILSSAINKKEIETWKVQRGSSKWIHSIWKEYGHYVMSLMIPE